MEVKIFSKKPLDFTNGISVLRETSVGCRQYAADVSGEPDAVTDCVFHALINSLSERRLRSVGSPFAEKDERTAEIFSQKLSAYLFITGNKSKIETVIKSVMAENGIIDIDGLITFRLKNFSNDISAFFDLLFYEYSVRRQYDDFIALLHDYVRLESPREDTVHIVFRGQSFLLYNAKRTNITYQALKNYNNESNFTEGNLNDFLISSLLHYLPHRIILHIEQGEATPRIVETIRAIFGKRAALCERVSCEFCVYGNRDGFMYQAYDDINS